MLDIDFKYKELISYLKQAAPFIPDTAIILGSGLGDFAKTVEPVKSLSTSELPAYPPSTIPGHEGNIHFADYAGRKLLLFQGRIHFYEGYHLSECILPAYIARTLGVKHLVATNAAGGVNPDFIPGDLMLIESFVGINLKKEMTELLGLSGIEEKQNFLNFPSPSLNSIIEQAAGAENILLRKGIYWYNKGPVYETPAEINMVRKFGGDAVGMSTVPEVYYAAGLGIKTSCISCITNYAAGISGQKLSHNEVTETANRVKEKFERLIKKTLSFEFDRN
ncbi:MAG TPA: purine-nucleoside phosphorylase [Ignavibacteriaceae bacterium]|nr:purine-nucleoside phosphorylase [Ignavibacteriaceae bacterium]